MNKKFLPLIVLLICATISILYWYLIYMPLQAEITRLNAESKQIETEIHAVETLQSRYGNLEDLSERALNELERMREYLPAEIEGEKFVTELYKIAEGKKILIHSIEFGETSEKDSVQSQIVKIYLESDYISLLNFIREILDGERLASFGNFSIARIDETNILNCELEFAIFAANWENNK